MPPGPAPAEGGIRLLLVATDRSKGEAPGASAPAVSGPVSIGGQTRIIMEPAEESVSLYYLLDVVNNAATAVNPPSAFVFEMPKGT